MIPPYVGSNNEKPFPVGNAQNPPGINIGEENDGRAIHDGGPRDGGTGPSMITPRNICRGSGSITHISPAPHKIEHGVAETT